MILSAAVILLFMAFILLWFSRRQEKSGGMPKGKIIYTDMRNWGRVVEPLYDPGLGLTGKPDYLVSQGDQILPVEVKSSRASHGPFEAHIYQLAAYCLLVERSYHLRPSYGILHYSDRTYQIVFTREIEKATRILLTELRQQGPDRQRHRSHDSIARCNHCGYRSICPERLR
jgi:CRISPR-associated exonuclease Cas4